MKQERKIIFYGNHFVHFYAAQKYNVREKIQYVFKIIRTIENVPKKFLEHITGRDGLFEIRIEYDGNIYRIFCCFDKGNLVILFNAFQKKTKKTPPQEIDLAVRLMKEYFTQKEDNLVFKNPSKKKNDKK